MEKYSFNNMTCSVENHGTNTLIGLCIDNNCTSSNKLVCLDCVFSSHSQHRLVKLKEIEDMINKELVMTLPDKSFEETLSKRRKEIEEKVTNKMEMVKTNLLEIFTNKMNAVIDSLHTHINDITAVNNKQIHQQITNQQSSKDYEGLSKSLTIYYNESLLMKEKPIKTDENNNDNILKEFDRLEKNYDNHIKGENQELTQFLKENFFTSSAISILNSDTLLFEWSDIKYGSYAFCYQLSNKNMTATKNIQDGTITVLRSKHPLGCENYYIEFMVDHKKGGDFDIGLGKDSVGVSCWIRTINSWSITTSGIYDNAKIAKKDIKIKDGDIVAFKLYFKSNPLCKVFLNTILVHEFPIVKDNDDLYILSAIRKTDNSITVKEFKLI